jgi:16S rRNA (cytosine1402-N4)-methyltransferase
MAENNLHYSVMLTESIESLELKPDLSVVDCTVNRAGHAVQIAKAIGSTGTLIMFDLDRTALREAKERLEKEVPKLPKLYFIHSNYRNIKSELEKVGVSKVDRIFADLGLSSQELEISGRGFTFQKDEPLYMTFNSEVDRNTFTAADLINNLSSANLEKIFQVYGDEPKSWKIANAIVEERENLSERNKRIETTGQLVEIIERVTGYVKGKSKSKTHPATRIFQAIRIAVNDEYEGIKDLIRDGYEILNEKGIMSIITFHSGEDRIVKKMFKELGDNEKIKPSIDEIKENRRSRSALLRTLKKNN